MACRSAERAGLREPVEITELEGRVGEQAVLVAGDGQLLDEDVGPAEAGRGRLVDQLVAGPQGGHGVGQRQAQVLQVQPQQGERPVERQRRREEGVLQDRVRGVVDVLRAGQQLGRGDRVAGVVSLVAVQGQPVGHEVLERLVDDVDVGQRGVGVGAGQRQVLQVGPAAEQDVLRVAEPGRGRGLVDVVQQVDQVGGRAEDRAAVRAAAVVEGPEQVLERGSGDDRVGRAAAGLRRRGDSRTGPGPARRGRARCRPPR